jgi:hypothetical protein
VYGTNIIAVSESLREHLVHELNLDPKHITTIPNGFETQRWISAQIFPWTDRLGFWKKTQQWYLRYKQKKSI